MVQNSARKEQPLSMRFVEADVAIIDRAAHLRGRSRTEFVRDAAVRAAEDIVMEAGLVRMSSDGFDAFMTVLESRPQPVPEMVEILQRRAPWESDLADKA